MIRFGTDGWRAQIAEDFTFDNVALCARAYALFAKAGKVAVGYDTRFLGKQFATHTAKILAASGIGVYLAKDYLPTPVLSFAAKTLGCVGGVMLTASHNPPEYQGFKLKGSYGGSATPQMVTEVEQHLGAAPETFDPEQHRIHTFDVRKAYYAHLASLLDMDALKQYKGIVYHDSMGGSGSGWLSGFVKYAKLPLELREIHGVPSPTFYGVNPEPIPQNLATLTAVMGIESGNTFAAVTDGDADRIGVVLAGGAFFNSHKIFAVLLRHLHRKGLTGRVVKTVSVSNIVAKQCELYGLQCLTTPVGFKYITDEFLQGDVLIGGEESGGIGSIGHIPERDGIYNALLLLESVVISGKSLAEQFAEIEAETGLTHAYDRLDLHLPNMQFKDDAMQKLAQPQPIAGKTVEEVVTIDGIKWLLSGGAWVMFRASGTEPVLRIYCEARTEQEVQTILQAATHIIGKPI